MKIRDLLKLLKDKHIDVRLSSGEELEINYGFEDLSEELLEDIKTFKAEIIVFLKQFSGSKDIGLAPKREYYPLSSSQRRLWVLSQFDEGNVAYNIPGVYLFRGDIDRAALSYCFGMVVSRHEVLRTVFREDADGEIGQYIQPETAGGFAIGYSDFRGRAGGDQELKALIGSESVTAFDLAAGPLLRAWLYQVSDQEWVFTYTMHHIISDGWSMGILIRELLKFYNSYVGGAAFSPPALTLQYKDYAWWQQSELKGERFQEHRRYWLDRFSGDLPVLELSGDRVRPAIKTYNGGVVSGVLDAALTGSLKALTQSRGCTLFMGLLSAVNGLLYRYTGQEDIIIGSPIAGREHADLEDQIGFYVNTLALRTQFRGSESYVDLLDRVKGVTLDAYEHQSYPFDELVGDLDLKRDMSRNAIFDVMVVLQNNEVNEQSYAAGHLSAGGASNSSYEDTEQVRSKFDLNFEFAESGEELRIWLEYNSDIYDRSTAERMLSHVSQLLSGMVAHPRTGLQELDYLSQQEREQLISGFNATAVDYPRDSTVIGLFEQQVSRTPDNIALVSGDVALSYRELNEQANRLAHYLKREGVTMETLVPICIERSSEMIIAILGILKAGGAYVPIDPEYPQDRINYMLEDAGAGIILSSKACSQRLLGTKANVINLDQDLNGLGMGEVSNPVSIIRPDQLAYVIYTSGSTGYPKGVMVEHRSLINYCLTFKNYFNIAEKDTILQQSSVSFDTIAEEIYPALISGAEIILLKEGGKDINAIKGYIESGKVSILTTTPTVIGLLNKELIITNNLRYIISGGEVLSPRSIDHLFSRVQIVNTYGPTEGTVCVSYHKIEDIAKASIIGKPISNAKVYIRNSNGQLAPIGIPGEICIGGVQVARGYLNLPELTSEKFIPNPFKPGERLYCSGDIGRWLEDGSIEYLGRRDDQVKIRGYRIELGEIESALRQLSQIEDVVVVSMELSAGEKELVCYVVSREELISSELRAHLLQQLPSYMVPGHFVQLDKLPLTVNGKLDKRSLPSPLGIGMESGVSYVAARNATEEKLVGIWQEILGVDRVGVTDNFFDLGGHSLKAMKVVSQIERQFKVTIKIQDMFNNETIASIGKMIQAKQWIQRSENNHKEYRNTFEV